MGTIGVPSRPAGMVERPRVRTLLARAVRHRLLTVTTPAGYGKTTALADYAATARGAVCWLSLERRDADARHFLGTLIAAVEQQFGGALRTTVALLGSSTRRAYGHVGASLVRELAAIEQEWLMILDDWHRVDSSDACAGLVGQLLACPRGHIVLSGRAFPSVPGIMALAAQGEMHGLCVAHLRCTAADVMPLVTGTASRLERIARAQRLVAQTNGRIGAIRAVMNRVSP